VVCKGETSLMLDHDATDNCKKLSEKGMFGSGS
jgi:hypothetical protein